MTDISIRKNTVSCCLSLVFLLPGPLVAGRTVVINGTQLNPSELKQLEQLACAKVPDGNYWLDMRSGAWGYWGNTNRMGYLGDACGKKQRRKSLSERGLLFRPGEIMSGR